MKPGLQCETTKEPLEIKRTSRCELQESASIGKHPPPRCWRGGGGIHLPSLLQTIKSTKSEEELEASMKGVLALMGVRWTYEKDHAVPIYDRKVSTSKTLIYFTLLFKNKLCGTCGIHCAVCFRHCHMIQYWNVSCRRRAVFCTS